MGNVEKAEVVEEKRGRGRPPLTKLGFRPTRDFTRRLSGKHTVELLTGILDHMVTDPTEEKAYFVSPELKAAVAEMIAAVEAGDWNSLAILSQASGFVIGSKPAKGRTDPFWEDASRYNMARGGDVPIKDILAWTGLHAAARCGLLYASIPEGAVTRYPAPDLTATESDTVRQIMRAQALAAKRATAKA